MSPLPLGRRHLAGAAFVVLVTLLCGYFRMVPGVIGTLHDDGLYVAAGKALATGQGYVLPNLPVEVPQTKYPPLLPFLFALIWKLSPHFPDNAVLFQVLCLSFLAAALGLSCLFLIRFRYASEKVALAAGLLAATNSFLLFYGSIPMALGPFTLLAVLVFWMTEETLATEENPGWHGFVAGCLVAMVGLCRTVGFVWLPALAVIFYIRRRKALAPFLAASLPAAIMWSAWSVMNRPDGTDPLISYYVSYAQDWADMSVSRMPKIVLTNLFLLYQSLGLLALPGLLVHLSLIVPNAQWSFLLVGLAVLLRIVHLGKGKRPLIYLIVIYFLPVLLHPWPPNRFLLPVMALFTAFLLTQSGIVLKKILPSWHTPALGIVIITVILNVAVVRMYHYRNSETGYPMAYFKMPPQWPSVQEAFAWIDGNTDEQAVIACWLDPMVWLYTGRRAIRFNVFRPAAWFYEENSDLVEESEVMLERLQTHRADFLLDIRKSSLRIDVMTREKLRELVDRKPPAMEKAFTSSDQGVSVYRILHGNSPRPTKRN
jgi:hypothetical protein